MLCNVWATSCDRVSHYYHIVGFYCEKKLHEFLLKMYLRFLIIVSTTGKYMDPKTCASFNFW